MDAKQAGQVTRSKAERSPPPHEKREKDGKERTRIKAEAQTQKENKLENKHFLPPPFLFSALQNTVT